ncbi:MAG: hypothetical protein ACK5IM_11605 [Demequina sp.]|uniref:hypothetical protein n=1 Tax=Demequina sp. TaxID=2050685 RepID=UPI003A89B6E3
MPPGIILVATLLMTAAGPPLWVVWDSGIDDGIYFIFWSYLAVILYAPFLIALMGGTAAAFRGMWISTRRTDLAAELALGSTRRQLVRAHVRAGAREGLAATGIGLGLGAVVAQLGEGFGPGYWDANALWLWLTVVAVGAISLVGAYTLVASWATRGSVTHVASGAPLPRAEARRGRRRTLTKVAVWCVALAVAAGVALWAVGGDTDLEVSGWRMAVTWVASSVLFALLYLAVPGVLAYGGARLGIVSARGLSRVVAAGAQPGGARALAHDALSRPTPMRTAAMLTVVVVMGFSTAMTVISSGTWGRDAVASDLSPHATVSSVPLDTLAWADGLQTPGWAASLPGDLITDLRADERLTVLSAGVLTTDAREVPIDAESSETETHQDVLLAVHSSAISALQPDAPVALGMGPATEWESWTVGSVGACAADDSYVQVDGERRETTMYGSTGPWSGVDRDWAESTWGAAPTAALLLYPSGDVPVSDVLADYDLAAVETVTFNPDDLAVYSQSLAQTALVTGCFLLVAIAMVIALAWSTQRLRAKDHATLLALGATPGALRGATALEAGIGVLTAGAAGVVGGATVGVLLDAFFGTAPPGAGEVLAAVGFTLSVVPWGMLAALVVGAAALAAIGASVIRIRLDRLSPAAQLVEAQKAGLP